jgi:hypothetical protein
VGVEVLRQPVELRRAEPTGGRADFFQRVEEQEPQSRAVHGADLLVIEERAGRQHLSEVYAVVVVAQSQVDRDSCRAEWFQEQEEVVVVARLAVPHREVAGDDDPGWRFARGEDIGDHRLEVVWHVLVKDPAGGVGGDVDVGD